MNPIFDLIVEQLGREKWEQLFQMVRAGRELDEEFKKIIKEAKEDSDNE